MKSRDLKIHVVANAALGPGLSGGDRIFIELARRWARAHRVTIYVWEEGYEMCQRNNLTGVNYVLWPAARWKKFGFPVLFLARTIIGCLYARRSARAQSPEPRASSANIVYSASDFWPDSLPALVMKRRLKNSFLIGTLYLSAPSPFSTDSPYKGLIRLKGLIYFLFQRPIYWAFNKWSDMIFVTSEPDAKRFINRRRSADRVIAVRGGVDMKKVKSQKLKVKDVGKRYDAVFQGRFHPQKGVLELIDIWKMVVKEKPGAKLAMIGDGPLFESVKLKIKNEKLEKNVKLLGFVFDGPDKYRIFQQSKIVVHPAIYDSGGMAACEAMAAGLPGVSFDLEALKTYYPKGMLKTPCFDFKAFADNVLKLLDDSSLYEETKRDALAWAKEWDWDKRALEITRQIETVIRNG